MLPFSKKGWLPMSINATSSFRPASIPSLVWSPQASSLMPQPSVVSYNTILSGYFKFGLVSEAIKLFDGTSQRDCHSWNIVLSGCVKSHKLGEALTHSWKCIACTSVRPDGFTYSFCYSLLWFGIWATSACRYC